ncbi:MAG: hypothetical protein RBU37_19440 [Myxococcota bacterium]|nr:hypothetical protein [Myxococcota bacterium]
MRKGPPRRYLPEPLAAGRKVRRTAAHAQPEALKSSGDPQLAEALGEALAAHGEFDRATQRFHSYPARLHPDAGKRILEALPGKSLLDPFCGGGTTLVEGLLDGRRVEGSDLSPIAVLVSHARTRVLDEAERQALRRSFETVEREAKAILDSPYRPFTPPAVLKLAGWYSRSALLELSALLESLQRQPEPHRALLRAVHSSLLVKYSTRASETSNKVVQREVREGVLLRAFHDKASEYLQMLASLAKAVPVGTGSAQVSQRDARELGPGPEGQQVESASNAVTEGFELALTSPPYPATYDYLRLQQLRLAWLTESVDALLPQEIGSRSNFAKSDNGMQQWKRDTTRWMAGVQSRLVEGGHLVVVVGDGIVGGKLLRAGDASREIAKRLGLRLRASATVLRRDLGVKKTKAEFIFAFVKEKPAD